MKVILLQDIANIGRKYEVVDVANGHALNFLIPNGKAQHADKGTIKSLEYKKESEEKEMMERQKQSMEKLDSLGDKALKVTGKANEEGHLFAKIGKGEIRDALKKELGLDVRESDILIDEPLKEVGEQVVRIKIGDEEREVQVNIEAE